MNARHPLDTTVECRLFIGGTLARSLHLDSAPSTISIHDDETDLVAVYARVVEGFGRAWYEFDHLR